MTGHAPNADFSLRRIPEPLRAIHLGCVSYLNTLPLIHGLHDEPNLRLHSDVPGLMQHKLASGSVDVALCPVIDFVTSDAPLVMLPDAGGIGCDGPTLTVRLLSRVPWNEVTRLHADTDSHTSVVLSRIVLTHVHGVSPDLVPWTPAAHEPSPAHDWPDTILLIGDKVITSHLTLSQYPWQMDLGQAWKQYTGLPFVFAVWMAHADLPPQEMTWVAARLEASRLAGAQQVNDIAARGAPAHGWPTDLARHYLGHLLKYHITHEARSAIERFWHEACQLQLIRQVPQPRWLELTPSGDGTSPGSPTVVAPPPAADSGVTPRGSAAGDSS